MSERLERVLRNMERLSANNAPPEDTLTYLRSEGYNPDTFANAVSKYNKAKGVITEFGPVRSALQGLSFGFSDEAEAGIKALLGKGTYEQNLASIQLGQEEFQQESPGTAIATEIAGGLPLMALGGLGAMRGMQALQRTAPGVAQRVSPAMTGVTGAAATGALGGGLAGAGTAEPGMRIAGATGAAPVGAALGTAGTVIPRAIGQVPMVERGIEIGRRALGMGTDYTRTADVKLLQALQRDGFSPQQVAERIQKIKASGYKPETIIEFGGENTRGLADVVAGYPGAAQVARGLAEERSGGQAGRVMTDFREAFKVNTDALDLAEDIIRARDRISKPLYQQAYQEGGVIADERIMGFMKIPQFKDAYARARRIAALDGIELPEKATDIERVGGFDLMTLDYIKRGLDDVLFTGKQPGSGIGKTELGKLKERRNEFVGIIDEAGPASYKQARQAFAGPTEVLDAIDQGKKFATLDARALKRQYDSLTPAEQDGFKVGVYDSIRTNINKGADGSDALRRVWGSPEKRDQLQVFLGPETFQDLTNQLAREKVIRQTDVRMMGGSPTQRRQLAQREFEAEEGIVPQMAERGVVRGGIDYLLRSATGPGQPTAEALAPTLFSTDYSRQLEAMTRLRALDDLLRQEAARSAGAIGTGVGMQSGLLGE
jgi:hypothetical protein